VGDRPRAVRALRRHERVGQDELEGTTVTFAAPVGAEVVDELLPPLVVEELLPVAVGDVVVGGGELVAGGCVVGDWVGAGAEDVDACGLGDADGCGSAYAPWL